MKIIESPMMTSPEKKVTGRMNHYIRVRRNKGFTVVIKKMGYKKLHKRKIKVVRVAQSIVPVLEEGIVVGKRIYILRKDGKWL